MQLSSLYFQCFFGFHAFSSAIHFLPEFICIPIHNYLYFHAHILFYLLILAFIRQKWDNMTVAYRKELPCRYVTGYDYRTALILSIFMGMFGIDRFYLG